MFNPVLGSDERFSLLFPASALRDMIEESRAAGERRATFDQSLGFDYLRDDLPESRLNELEAMAE